MQMMQRRYGRGGDGNDQVVVVVLGSTVDFAYKAPLRPASLGAFYPIEPFIQNDDFFPYQGEGCISVMTTIKYPPIWPPGDAFDPLPGTPFPSLDHSESKQMKTSLVGRYYSMQQPQSGQYPAVRELP